MGTSPSLLTRCELCPKKCGVNRVEGELGFCGAGKEAVVAHYGLHFGEEPPLSGTKGSGTVFFSPCNLRCLFCQNYQISHHTSGRVASSEDLAGIFMELQTSGAHNINLVSPTPYVPQIADAIGFARGKGVSIPFVYNTNGYETAETIGVLRGLIDIYFPDFKYWNSNVAARLSSAPHYPTVAAAAILEMKAQVGHLLIEDGIAKRGLLVRHLVLPANLAGTRRVLEWIKEYLGTETTVSLMSQYSPICRAAEYPIINRRIRADEYDPLVRFAAKLGLEHVYLQEPESADVYLPDFDRERPFQQK
jgi:putative pyruvate formate lyase activating enzyme